MINRFYEDACNSTDFQRLSVVFSIFRCFFFGGGGGGGVVTGGFQRKFHHAYLKDPELQFRVKSQNHA